MTLESRASSQEINASQKTTDIDVPARGVPLPKLIKSYISPQGEIPLVSIELIAGAANCNPTSVERFLRGVGMQKKRGDGTVWYAPLAKREDIFDRLEMDNYGTILSAFKREGESLRVKNHKGHVFRFR
jgi:hypothetical protein